MDHSRIEEHNLIDRYVRGTLPADRTRGVRGALCGLRRVPGTDPGGEKPSAGGSRIGGRNAREFRMALDRHCRLCVLRNRASCEFYFSVRAAETRSELASPRSSLERAPVVFGLSLSRDAAEARDVTIPAEPRWVVFLAEIDATRYSRYRAALVGSQGEETWSKDGIEANSPDSISVSIPSAALHPGTYTLVVSGTQTNGPSVTIARFPLRLTAQ